MRNAMIQRLFVRLSRCERSPQQESVRPWRRHLGAAIGKINTFPKTCWPRRRPCSVAECKVTSNERVTHLVDELPSLDYVHATGLPRLYPLMLSITVPFEVNLWMS